MKKEKVVLFDLDGTLIDSTDAILESFHMAFEKQSFDFQGTNEDIKNEIGYPLDVMFGKLGVEKQKVWDYVDSYKEHYRTISEEKTYALENAIEAVKEASTFARLGVVTTKTTLYSIPLLEKLGIYHYFEAMVGRQEVQNPKPHPEPIYKALEQLNIEAHDNIYMIGDTKLDLIAANEANISCVGVLCGYGIKSSLNPYTKHITKDSLEAVNLIKKL